MSEPAFATVSQEAAPRRGSLRLAAKIAVALVCVVCLVGVIAFEIAVRARPVSLAALEPQRSSSTTVLGAAGEVLRQMATSSGGRQTFLKLDRIAPHWIEATIAGEDRRFFHHHGVDPVGVLRAVWLDIRARRAAFGGSTLTMQLARMLEPLPRGRRKTLGDKWHEAVMAGRLERALTKEAILEQYLNRAYYGNGAWGAEAAAYLYFGKTAADLSLGESAFLSVLPRSPRRYNPYRHLGDALERRKHILGLMVRAGKSSPVECELALRTPLELRREHPDFSAPHFVDHVLQRLPAEQREGATIYTTLDASVQKQIEVSVRDHLSSIGRHVGQAAVLVLRNSDGAVLSMVGSPDYFDAEHAGATNATTALRRPGSTLKPFVYGIAMERGDTPATVANDVVLPDETHESYASEVKQHGYARYREALAGSYNLAAVHTLRRVGPSVLAARLRRAGLTTLDKPDEEYGPGLAIGEVETRLIELTAAYAAFGTGGTTVPPHPIAAIREAGKEARHVARVFGRRIFSPEVAYLIFDMLSDPDARRPMFGDMPPVFAFPVALKTGTTRGYTDNWAFGVTREFTVGAWAGNFDGKPTDGVLAMQGAAPLVRAAFVALAARFGEPSRPPRPSDVIDGEVCAASGMRPGPQCRARKRDVFLRGTVPAEPCTWHRTDCGPANTSESEAARGWGHTRVGPHLASCPAADEGSGLRILFPVEGSRFLIEPGRPLEQQIPPMRASPMDHRAEIQWTVDGESASTFRPSAGEHRIRAEWRGQRDEVRVDFD